MSSLPLYLGFHYPSLPHHPIPSNKFNSNIFLQRTAWFLRPPLPRITPALCPSSNPFSLPHAREPHTSCTSCTSTHPPPDASHPHSSTQIHPRPTLGRVPLSVPLPPPPFTHPLSPFSPCWVLEETQVLFFTTSAFSPCKLFSLRPFKNEKRREYEPKRTIAQKCPNQSAL